jgi:hypothetical protein
MKEYKMSHKVFRLFFVLAFIIGSVMKPASQSAHAAGPWYVSTTGSDANDCLSQATTCATINGALNKPSFVAGDTILVAIGTYTGAGNEVVLLDKDASLSGGWDETFTIQGGMSTIDGEGARRGMAVNSVTTVEAFIIQNGSASDGGGIFNSGALTLNNTTVSDNSAAGSGGGISNSGGTVTLNNSLVNLNTSAAPSSWPRGGGGGISNDGGGTVTLNNSVVNGNSAAFLGGGIFNDFSGTVALNNSAVSNSVGFAGGGIFNYSTLTLTNSAVNDNSATSATDGGGGIYSLGGLLTLNNTTVSGNSAANLGGGIFSNAGGTITLNNTTVSGNSAGYGGGIANGGMLTLNNSTVSGNSAITGGGILAAATVTLNNSTVSGNSAGYGSGIANSGVLTLNNTTVSGNSAANFGGGIFSNTVSPVTLNNTTVSGNSAAGSGGGLYNSFQSTGLLTLNYSTVTNNTSDSDSDGSGDGGGMYSGSTATLQSSIVAGNKKGASGLSDVTADCAGAVTSQGYNLTGSGTGCSLSGAGDVTAAPANVFTDVLGVLADNGGPTQTHALIFSPGNPALDAILSGANSCGFMPFDLDQRGVARPQGSACDIGAFEFEAVNQAIGVVIDIEPGKDPNRIEIEPDDDGDDKKISVAILSTEQFNAIQQVDRNSLTFGTSGDENSLNLKGRKHTPDCRTKDVNKDGLSDLVCKFKVHRTGFQLGDTVGILKGLTMDGSKIEGQDSVVIRLDD